MTTPLSAFTGTDDNKVYFFSGDQYIRYDKPADRADDGYPLPIRGNWPGLLFNEIMDTFIKKLGGGGGRRPSWHSMEQLSRQANATLGDFVAANEGKRINFVSVDFFQNARAVELAVNLCRQRSAEAAAAGVS